MNEATYWNGEPAPARRVVVRVPPWNPDKHAPQAWWKPYQRTWRKAVEVRYGKHIVIYLDDEDGSGWRKVTAGQGSPRWGHYQLPNNVLVRGDCARRDSVSENTRDGET